MQIHKEPLGSLLYAFFRFMPCGSEQISLNCMYFQLNISSIPINGQRIELNIHYNEYLTRSVDHVTIWS